jgi:hypothetical protein
LSGGGLAGLLLLGQRPACLVGVLGRPVQLGAQLAGAALDLLGAGLGRVRVFLGRRPVGRAARRLPRVRPLRRPRWTPGGIAGLPVARQFVGQLGCLVAVGFQLGPGLFQPLPFNGQACIRQVKGDCP